MDLILLQPGAPSFFPNGDDGWNSSGSFVDHQWRDANLKLGPCIELVSLHQGMRQQITSDNPNSTEIRPILTVLTCVKYVDKISVKLYDYCLRAMPIGKGKDQPTLLHILRNAGDQTATVLTLALRDAIVSEIQLQTHPDDMATEQFKLNFSEILWTYGAQSAATAGNASSGWSLKRNRPIGQFTD